jgi:hypothetical protein
MSNVAVSVTKASAVDRRLFGARPGHFIAMYARAWSYQVVELCSRTTLTGSPEAPSKGAPLFAACMRFDRHESASAFVVNDRSNRCPDTIQRTRYSFDGPVDRRWPRYARSEIA